MRKFQVLHIYYQELFKNESDASSFFHDLNLREAENSIKLTQIDHLKNESLHKILKNYYQFDEF